MLLVSLTQASQYVRRDTTDDDAELTFLIEAASGAVINYLSSAPSIEFLDSDGNPQMVDSDGVAQDVPPVVQAATLYLVAWMYRNRDENAGDAFAPGFLPAPVTALLAPIRDPVFR